MPGTRSFAAGIYRMENESVRGMNLSGYKMANTYWVILMC